jgi:hypothetical protein
MAKELGKIEKPSAEEFKRGRKLYFVPLIYGGEESPPEYLEKFNKYWDQVENQVSDLELKLGPVNKIYHELIPVGGNGGIEATKELNDKSYQIAKNRLGKGAQLEATEEAELLTEFMDWSRCLAIGLQNQKVFTKIYESYTEVSKKRNEHIARQIDETLKADEIGLLLMREGHQVQFPSDIQVFYVAPPALDEIKRWLRDYEAKLSEESISEAAEKGDSQ